MPPATRLALEGIQSDILGSLAGKKPRLLLIYNAHQPLEPMAEQARILSGVYDQDTLAAYEFPPAATPFGHYRKAFDLLQTSARRMAAGESAPEGVSAATARRAGSALALFLDLAARDESGELARLLGRIPYTAQGSAERPIHDFLGSLGKETGLDSIEERNRIVVDATAPLGAKIEEEHVIAAMHERLPDTDFISLHASFGVVSLLQMQNLPFHTIEATKEEYSRLGSLERNRDFFLSELSYDDPIPFLDLDQYLKALNATVFELFYPVQYLWTAASFRVEPDPDSRTGKTASEVRKATVARYLLDRNEPGLQYDYFFRIKIEEEHGWVEDHVKALRGYLKWRHGLE